MLRSSCIIGILCSVSAFLVDHPGCRRLPPTSPCTSRPSFAATTLHPLRVSTTTSEEGPEDAYDRASSRLNNPAQEKLDDGEKYMTKNDDGTNPEHTPPINGKNQTSKEFLKSARDKPCKEGSTSRSLYEVLGASPSDSKQELKRRYIALAKRVHPDAVRGNNAGLMEMQDIPTDLDFSEIAAAYRVLSDSKQRRRYDRTLKAEAFSKELQIFANDVTDKAAPKLKDIFDTVAMPFLSRTTVYAVASIQAAAAEISSPKGDGGQTSAGPTTRDFGSAFMSAMKAAERAAKIANNLELVEKCEVLDESNHLVAVLPRRRANTIKSELDKTTMKRLTVALTMPNATFTSADASSLLNYWNLSSSHSLLERAKLKHPVDQKIEELKTVEMSLADKTHSFKTALEDYNSKEKALQKARADKVIALQAEKRAREALAKAQSRVANSFKRVDSSAKSLSRAESTKEKLAFKVERLANGVAKQQEDVRSSLHNKISKELARRDGLTEQGIFDSADLQQLLHRELELVEEYNALESKATRLQAKSSKHMERAEP